MTHRATLGEGNLLSHTIRNRRVRLLLALALIIVLGAGGALTSSCTRRPTATGATTTGPDPAKGPVKVRLSETVHSVFYAPQYVAATKGFFKEFGLEVEINTAWGSDKGAAAVLSGNADIALAGPEPSLYVFNQKGQTRLKIFAQLTAKDGSFLLAKKKVDKFDWSQVKGKTIIGNRPGSMPEMVIEDTLKRVGLTPQKDVTVITNLAFTAIPGAFASGQAEYAGLFEPTASQFEAQGVGFVVASMGIEGGPLPYTVYMATEKYIAENPKVVQAFTNAMYKAMLWVESHSNEEVADAVLPFYADTARDLMVKVIKRYKEQGTWAPDPVLNPTHFDNLQKIMIGGGALKPEEKVKYEDVVITTFAEQAKKKIK